MKPKTVVTVALLVFVGVSVGALIVKERRGVSAAQTESHEPVQMPGVEAEVLEMPEHEGERSLEMGESPAASVPDTQVVVYYFHGAKRCATCMKIEAYTREEVENTFADLLRDRTVEWKVINVDEVENEHFVQDYALSTRSVVVSLRENGQEKDWKVLEEVWQLVDAKPEFQRYVRTEVEEFLMKGSEPQ